jgi:hypothetical protein
MCRRKKKEERRKALSDILSYPSPRIFSALDDDVDYQIFDGFSTQLSTSISYFSIESIIQKKKNNERSGDCLCA